jgi:aryl-alcohol dehydrogenase-like predicted oxidoreductase
LRRLGTDNIEIYRLHSFDALTPVEEALSTLNHLVESEKARYIASSNFSGCHLMKSLDVSQRYGWSRYVGHEVYYSLVGREYESHRRPQRKAVASEPRRSRMVALARADRGSRSGQ